MALIVKIMSGEGGPDDDTRKGYALLTGVTNIEFGRELHDLAGGGSAPVAVAYLTYLDGDASMPEKRYPSGNVYVMNEAGKTISSFGCAPLDCYHAAGQAPQAA